MSSECVITDEDVEFVKKLWEDFKKAALVDSPYYAFLASRLRVEVTCQVPVAATNGATLLINPKFFRQLYKVSPDKAEDQFNAVILHELEHVTRLHPFRLRSYASSTKYPLDLVKEVFNIVSDAQINHDLFKAGFILPKGAIYPDLAKSLLGVEVLGKSVESAVTEYLSKLPMIPMQSKTKRSGLMGGGGGVASGQDQESEEQAGSGGSEEQEERGQPGQVVSSGARGKTCPRGGGGLSQREQGGGEDDLQKPLPNGAPRDVLDPGRAFKDSRVIQEGDPEIKRTLEKANQLDPDTLARELEGAVKRAIADAYTGAKVAGKIPGHLERIIKEILKPIENWKNLIRSAMQGLMGSSVKRTWSIPNRKAPGARPGRVTRGVKEIYVLMDVSGSIGERELTRFASEIAGIAQQLGAKVTVIPWDVGMRGKQVIRNRSGAAKIRVTGGGGTQLLPSLREAMKIIRPGSPVVILSDWLTDDDPKKLIQELEKLARTNELILASVHTDPPKVRGAKAVKLTV